LYRQQLHESPRDRHAVRVREVPVPGTNNCWEVRGCRLAGIQGYTRVHGCTWGYTRGTRGVHGGTGGVHMGTIHGDTRYTTRGWKCERLFGPVSTQPKYCTILTTFSRRRRLKQPRSVALRAPWLTGYHLQTFETPFPPPLPVARSVRLERVDTRHAPTVPRSQPWPPSGPSHARMAVL
jgi:hypothetical protein